MPSIPVRSGRGLAAVYEEELNAWGEPPATEIVVRVREGRPLSPRDYFVGHAMKWQQHDKWRMSALGALRMSSAVTVDAATARAVRASRFERLANGATADPRAVAEPTVDDDALKRLFNELVARWKDETEAESSIRRASMHKDYLRIIGLGPPAVPLILHELEREPDYWFWALTSITGEDPARGESSLASATARWLEWGRERGLLE
jgi:hypothetical protein